jgi:hypothetical protein
VSIDATLGERLLECNVRHVHTFPQGCGNRGNPNVIRLIPKLLVMARMFLTFGTVGSNVMGMKYVRFGSHRARQSAFAKFDEAGLAKPEAFYSWNRDAGKGIYQLSEDHLSVLQDYPYGRRWYTTLRGPFDDLRHCW